MPIAVTCSCGAAYSLRDEYAGTRVRCTACGAPLQVGVPAEPPGLLVDPVFARDKFLLRQKHLSIAEKYEVWDEQGRPILFVERPAHLLRNVGAVILGFLAGTMVGILLGIVASMMPSGALALIVALLAVFGWIAVFLVVGIGLSAKRHVSFYRDPTKSERLLEILQDQKISFLNATYTLRDPAGQVLARFRKNYLFNLIRKRWYCYAPDGSLLSLAKEDSVILSLLRRFLGTFLGLLRTNFILLDPSGTQLLGEFNRKFTLLDRYVLDMSRDAEHRLDRRIAIAIGVLLDTGERR